MARSLRLTLVLASLAILALAFAIAPAACTGGGDSGGGRTTTDDDQTDDDAGDDDGGDDTGQDCSDVRANPYCLDGVTFEMPAGGESVIKVRSLFLRFDNYDIAANAFDADVAAGTASSPAQPDTDYLTSGSASYANNPGWSISLPELMMPVEIDLPFAKASVEADVTVVDVELTGIFAIDGSDFTFGSVAFTVPGPFLAEILEQIGPGLCEQLAAVIGFNPCEEGFPVERQNLNGTRRDDAQW